MGLKYQYFLDVSCTFDCVAARSVEFCKMFSCSEGIIVCTFIGIFGYFIDEIGAGLKLEKYFLCSK